VNNRDGHLFIFLHKALLTGTVVLNNNMNQQSMLKQLQKLKLSGMAKRCEAILNHQSSIVQHTKSEALVAALTEIKAGCQMNK